MKDPTEKDHPLVPSRDDWADRVEEILQGDDVDADLGRRMARDAIRVSRGEMSDREFHEKYRDEVVQAFETDDWEIQTDESAKPTDDSTSKEDDSDNE